MSTNPDSAAPVTGLPVGLTIGLLGGTGDQGRGLARRLALAGYSVILGSRDAGRATAQAELLGLGITGTDNSSCASDADIVIVAVPYNGHAELLGGLGQELAGKIVVDCVNPLGFDTQGAYVLAVPDGSAAEEAARVLPGSRVVGAFHNVSAVQLLDPDLESVECDVLVLGDDREATDAVEALVESIPGMRGVFAGRLRNSAQVEGLTANLIAINRRCRAHASLRITGI
jgi:NADPH-dependent F420 reductase